MEERYDHPETITKAELGTTVPHRFTLNRSPIVVAGEPWKAGTLLFLGFAGNHVGAQRYDGHYRFRLAQNKDSERDFFDVTTLPGWVLDASVPLIDADVDDATTLDPKARTSTEPATEETNDGVHPHGE